MSPDPDLFGVGPHEAPISLRCGYRAGFSLLELLIVVVIILLLAGMFLAAVVGLVARIRSMLSAAE